MTEDESIDPKSTSPQIDLLHVALPQYGVAAPAMHLVQSIVSRKLKAVLDAQRDHIKVAWKLEEALGEIMRSVFPAFPEDDYEYDPADIHVRVWLGNPQYATLWLFLRFPRASEREKRISINVGLEVSQKYRRAELVAKVGRHPNLFEEEWDGYSVGLSRELKSIDSIEEEAKALLGDYIAIFET